MTSDEAAVTTEGLDVAVGPDRVVREFAPGDAGVGHQRTGAAIDVDGGVSPGGAGA